MIRRRSAFLANVGLLTLFAARISPPTEQVRPTAQRATSSWAMVRWTPIAENPVFTGTGRETWDRKIRERGYILLGNNDTYHLWYTGYAGDRPTTMSLGHATSPDGIHWTRDASNPIFNESWVEDMCVLHRDGTYILVAEGKNYIANLFKSTDGRKWIYNGELDIRKHDGKPIDPGPYGTPTLWFENGTWYLFYEPRRPGNPGWLCQRTWKVWTNLRDDPVITAGPEPYDKTAVALNQVVKRDGWYYGFYHANSNRPWKNWTTCVARSSDLWSIGRSIPETRSSKTIAQARFWCEPLRARIGSTPCTLT